MIETTTPHSQNPNTSDDEPAPIPYQSLHNAVQFLQIELSKQLQLIIHYVASADPGLALSSLKRRDYVDNQHIHLLRALTQRLSCATTNQTTANDNLNDFAEFYGYNHLSQQLHNFSRILDELVFHLQQLEQLQPIQKKPLFRGLNHLDQGLKQILPALHSPQLHGALSLCRTKVKMDKYAKRLGQKIIRHSKKSGNIEQALQANLIAADLIRLGETLLYAGEAIMSAKLGQPIEIQRYRSLEATVNKLDLNTHDLSIHALGETKSGCTISGLRQTEKDEDRIIAVFKQGDKAKLNEEKQRMERWQEKMPGLSPRLYAYHRNGDKAAMLYEFLPGETLDKWLTKPKVEALNQALQQLFVLLPKLWQSTQIEAPRPAHFSKQLQKRLKDIYQVHPHFKVGRNRVGSIQQESLETLIQQADKIESKLYVPKAVYIHGDFNLDNIIYHHADQSLNFIDLHRSEYLDYVQDLSVLMVSFYRLMNFDPLVRKRIRISMQKIYNFGAQYAHSIEDNRYHIRMALGLARSFLTSTRFVLDQTHAKAMHYRGRYLLEQLASLPSEHYDDFQIAKEIFND